jgi:hypothetical protein
MMKQFGPATLLIALFCAAPACGADSAATGNPTLSADRARLSLDASAARQAAASAEETAYCTNAGLCKPLLTACCRLSRYDTRCATNLRCCRSNGQGCSSSIQCCGRSCSWIDQEWLCATL